MISRKELAVRAQTLGFNLYQAEKDYLQHVLLEALYRKTKTEWVFKGGTCLQKTMGLDRFSEDLDFTYNGNLEPDAAAESIKKLRADVPTTWERKKSQGQSVTLKAKIQGPLFDGRDKTLQHVTVEISFREKVILPPEVRRVVPPYDDLVAYTVYAMDAKEVLAEKVRAILTRRKARDVYDAWFLLQKNASTSIPEINQKLAYYGIAFDDKTFVQKLDAIQKTWQPELSILIRSPPSYAQTAKAVLDGIRAMAKPR